MGQSRLVVMRQWMRSACPKRECRQEGISLQSLRTHMAPSLVWQWLSTGLHWGNLRLSPARAVQGDAVGDPTDESLMGSSPPAKNLWRGPVTSAQPPDEGWSQISQISQKFQSQGTPWGPFHLLQPALTATSLFWSGQVLDSLLMRLLQHGKAHPDVQAMLCWQECALSEGLAPKSLPHSVPSHR